MLNQAGLEATLPYLGELTDKWQAAGAKKGLPHKQQAEELARHTQPVSRTSRLASPSRWQPAGLDPAE